MNAISPIIANDDAQPVSAPYAEQAALIDIQAALLAASDRIHFRHSAVCAVRNALHAVMDLGPILWISGGAKPQPLTMSGQDTLDRTTPFAQWTRRHLKQWEKRGSLKTPFCAAMTLDPKRDGFDYPFVHICYVPFTPRSRVADGGLLFTRAVPFSEAEQARLAVMTAQCALIAAAKNPRPPARLNGRGRLIFWSSAAALLALSFIPIRTTALAPAEITAQRPSVVSAAIDGVIADIYVRPGQTVQAGHVLARLDDTQRRNAVILADRALRVADGRLRQASLSAFADEAARNALSVAQAERDLAQAKLDFASDQLGQTVLRAPRAGITLFSATQDLRGHPVRPGDAIVTIAEPTRVLLRIHAPLAHGESLHNGARVRFFPDSNPLRSHDAILKRVDLEPAAQPDGSVAYQADAALTGLADGGEPLRIGARGVAKIYGEHAPLGYVLMRRPLTLARQWTGL